jgi:hypothetical protein
MIRDGGDRPSCAGGQANLHAHILEVRAQDIGFFLRTARSFQRAFRRDLGAPEISLMYARHRLGVRGQARKIQPTRYFLKVEGQAIFARYRQ